MHRSVDAIKLRNEIAQDKIKYILTQFDFTELEMRVYAYLSCVVPEWAKLLYFNTRYPSRRLARFVKTKIKSQELTIDYGASNA